MVDKISVTSLNTAWEWDSRLNDRVAFNMQLIGSLIGKSQIQNQTIDGSSLEVASLQFSATILITRKLFIEPIVVIGMTQDAFDSTIGIRIPYRF